uniref:G-protein coupled receptors family 3 profile domain-containing protein n=1 Tax=Glossina austeni TaxID=7395 RepID=A0A1A9UWG4_GLOAU
MVQSGRRTLYRNDLCNAIARSHVRHELSVSKFLKLDGGKVPKALGTSGIDIDLRRVDIDQCPQRNTPGTTQPLNIFAGTDKCKQRTTMCEALKGLGFRRGSYKCVCRKGYYFPDTGSQHKYFNGSLLEVEYEKLMLGKNSTYNIVNEYECLQCAEGCDYCEDSSPCIAALNWPMRTSILVLACIVIGLLPPAAWFTFRYQQVKNIVMYPNPNLYTCTARIWLREIGFSLTYGALMLKTWRISVIFRVRSAKAVKITDAALLKRLGCICGAIGTCLLVRTLVSPPDVVVGRTADDLKAFLCKTDWWDYTFTSMEVVFLAWGVRLCIMVRKAPSEFNESRFISMAIYNEFLLTCFLNVSMLFLQSPANPDLLYIIFFCHTQLTITLLLCLIFGSKVYIVLRSGKSHQESISMGAKSTGAKFNFRPQVRTFVNTGSVTASTVPIAGTSSLENKLSEQEALEEIRQLSVQLQRIQEMAPPKGVAVMTISSLLDGLKTPGGMMMVAAAATQAVTSGNQLALSQRKPEALPLLSLNNEMQKYTQLKVPSVSLPPTTTTGSSTNSNTIPATINNNVCSSSTIAANELQPSSQPPSTYVTTMTTNNTTKLELQLKSYCKEKSINTDLSGNCVSAEMLSNHRIICGRCYEQCTQHYHTITAPASATATATANSPCKRSHELAMQQPVNKCQLLGSPQPEGIGLRFKNVKLDCMCSQADDLDQLPQRRISCRKRAAATNTPPCTSRNRYNQSNQSNAKAKGHSTSSASLPCVEATTIVPSVSYRICDSCKTKFSVSSKMTKKKHRKLAQLSSKCSKLLSELEEKNIKTSTSITTTASQILEYGTNVTQLTEKVYSTDDIIFYTTTDEDDEDENNCSDSDSDSYEANHSNGIKLSCDVSKVSLSNLSSSHETKVSETQPLTATVTVTSHITPESNAEKLDTDHSKPSSSQTTDPSNGRPKRPDKLILNLNDRSKFTKEVSV